MKRPDLSNYRKESERAGNYFLKKTSSHRFVSSGCVLLDCVLGGGFPIGRIVNIVGDKAVGKTLLAIEAIANFHREYPQGKIWYRETEAAFDTEYARMLGLPVEDVDFGDHKFFTVEDIFDDIRQCIKSIEKENVGIYILDSLDALSDKAELERDMDQGTYGATKAKKMSELFRRVSQLLEDSNILLIIISQVRDKIGVMFGEKHTRSGGRALDFYASQILYLSQLKKISKTVNKIKRPVGVYVSALCKKNKIGMPYRSCEFPIIFSFGIDNLAACTEWLKSVDRLEEAGLGEVNISSLSCRSKGISVDTYFKYDKKVRQIVPKVWKELEQEFMPTFGKYDG